MNLDIIGMLVGTIVTLAIFSYLIGDNVLYRWALALLVGAGTGYAMAIVLRFILLDWIQTSLAGTTAWRVYHVIPLVLGALLLFKGLPKLSQLGNMTMGFILGVGAAVAISGALLGTLIPLVRITGNVGAFSGKMQVLLDGVLMLAGTILALWVFSPRPRPGAEDFTGGGTRTKTLMLWLQRIGRAFVITGLAVAFAGALTSAFTLFVERLYAVFQTIPQLIGLIGG
ncbi:MAG: hypothetical protein JXB35_05280 [Anaerolineae bacterium]|nr:hypothetical protein [Anaerolineae bacterium]